MSMTMSEAKEQETYDRNCVEVKRICTGCEETRWVDFDKRTDEPFTEEEPCEDCGTNEWLDA